MQNFNSGYKGNHKSMFIVPIGDLHIGNKYYCEEYLNKALQFVDKNRSRCRIYLMGDLLELASKTSVGRGVYDENMNTQQQSEKVIEIFKPYADLIDIVVEGNHEERIIRDTSFEILENFTHRVGCRKAYAKFEGIVNTRVGDLVYSAYVWHGATGGTKEASALNSLLGMRERAIANMYFMGHTHKLIDFTRKVYLPNLDSDEAKMIEQLFVNTGTALGDGGYGIQKGFALQSIGFGAVEIFADGKKMVFHKIDDLV
jgi:hypothetical protein